MENFQSRQSEKERLIVDVSPNIITEFGNSKVKVKSNTELESGIDLSKKTIMDGIFLYLYGTTTKRYIETLDDFLSSLVPEEDIININIHGRAHAYEIILPTAGTMHYSMPSSILQDIYTGEIHHPTFTNVTLDLAKGGFRLKRKDPLFSEKLNALTRNTFNVSDYLPIFYNERKDAGIKDVVLSRFSRLIVKETIAPSITPECHNESISYKTGSFSFSIKSTALENRIIIEDYDINLNVRKYLNSKE